MAFSVLADLARFVRRVVLISVVFGIGAALLAPQMATAQTVRTPLPGWGLDLLKEQGIRGADSATARQEAERLQTQTAQPQASLLGLPASQVVPNVKELSRALKCDPDLIYRYVLNNIELEYTYGSKKSSLEVILSGHGNPFGQAKLMADLLRASDDCPETLDPKIVVGDIWLASGDVVKFLGLGSGLTGPQALQVAFGLLHQGGFPATGFPLQSPVLLQITTAWVQVTIDSTVYYFNPWLKRLMFDDEAGVSLDSILSAGCDASSLLDRAENGGGGWTAAATWTSSEIKSIDYTALYAQLDDCAGDLIDYIRSNAPTASLIDIVGGRTITPLPYGTAVRETTPPYFAPNVTPTVYDPDALPDGLRTKLDISGMTFAGTTSLYADEISGSRLTITFNAQNKPELRLNGGGGAQPNDPIIVGQSAINPGVASTLTLAVDEPYFGTYGDQSTTLNVTGGSAYQILNGWGVDGRGAIEYHRKRLEENKAASGASPADEPVIGETLAMTAAAWLAQVSQSNIVSAAISNSHHTPLHAVGLTGFKIKVDQGTPTGDGSPYIDVPMLSSAFWLKVPGPTPSATTDRNAFFAALGVASALEGTVIDQVFPDEYAASTISLLALANEQNLRIFGGTSTNWSNIAAVLNNGGYGAYNSACNTGSLQCQLKNELADNGFLVILPESAELAQQNWDWQGYAALGILDTPNAVRGSYRISETSGGFSTVFEAIDTYVENINVFLSENPDVTGNDFWGNPLSYDPISLFTGDFIYEHDDLTLGSMPFPYGLGFQRTYSSGARLTENGLGLGWRHNFDITATVASDGLLGMGEDSGLAAAPFIVAMKIGHDLFAEASGSPELQHGLMAALVEYWSAQKLVQNTVTVSQPSRIEQFVELPDGTFAQPSRSSALLVDDNGQFVYQTVAGDKLTFVSSGAAKGKIETFKTPEDFTVTFDYDGDKLVQVRNDFSPLVSGTDYGRSLVLSYDANDRIDEVAIHNDSGANVRSVTYDYDDTAGTLTDFYDALNHRTKFTYTANNQIHEIFMAEDLNAAFVTNVYDSVGRVQNQTNAADETYTYFFAGTRAEEVDPLNFSTIYEFDGFGNTTLLQDPVGRITTYAYDGRGRLTDTFFPEENAIKIEYDDAGCIYNPPTRLGRCTNNVAEIQNIPKPNMGASTLTQAFTYENESKFNQLASSTDARSNTTTYTYDSFGNRLTTTQPAPASTAPVTTNTYYSTPAVLKGFLKTQEDPTGVKMEYLYSSSTGDKTADVQDPDGTPLYTCYSYNYFGDLTDVADPRFAGVNCASLATTTKKTEYAYDANRNRTQATFPEVLGSSGTAVRPITSFVYNDEDRLTETRSLIVLGGSTKWQKVTQEYNALRLVDRVYEPVVVTNPATPTPSDTIYSYWLYDERDRILETGIDGANAPQIRRTRRTYYADSRAHKVISAYDTALEQDTATYTYTDNGQIDQMTDANGNISEFEYDGHDRLAKMSYPNAAGGGVSATDYESYTYDANSNMETRRLRSGSEISFDYDVLNRLTLTDYPGATPDVSYEYDLAGRRTAANTTAYGTSYTYDPKYGRLLTETQRTRTITYAYDMAGNRTQIQWPSSPALTIAYVYDALSRVTQIKSGATVLATYSHDELSRRIELEYVNGTSAAYAYHDDANLASLAQDLSGTANDVTFDLTYNDADQIIQNALSNDAFMFRPYANAVAANGVNGLNQVTEVAGVSTGHDALGDLTMHPAINVAMPQPALTLGYDAANRVISADVGGVGTATYAYDGEGRRTQKTLTQGSQATDYLYSGDTLIAEYDGSGALLKRYIPGVGVDESAVIYGYSGGSLSVVRYVHADPQGSIIALTTSSGALSERYRYGPYGEVHDGGDLPSAGYSPFRYTGQYWDAETGLYYYKARYYSAAMGRFVSPDPVGYDAGTNLYAYVGNDPLNFTDPLGLSSESTANSVSNDNWSVLAFVAPAAKVAGRTVVVTVGSAFAAFTAAAAVALTPTELGDDSCNPPNCGNQYVVRAGIVAAKSLESTGVRQSINGFGFSVQTAPGLSPEQLAAGAPRIERYRQFSITTTFELQSIPGVVVNAPTPGGGPNHGTVNVPFPPPPGIFRTISDRFTQRPNPFYNPNWKTSSTEGP